MNKIVLLIFFIILLYLIFFKNNEGFINNDISLKIFCINLDKSKERWSNILKQANNENININRFSAINGNEINNDLLKKFNVQLKKKIKKGAVGCALSHIKLLKKIQKEKTDYCLILEDDIIIPNNFNDKLKKYINEIDFDFDIIFIGGCNIFGKKVKENFIKPIYSKKQYKNKYNLCCHAMLVKPNNVNNILNALNPLERTIDTQLRENIDNLNIYYLNPSLIYQNREISSDLQSINLQNNNNKANKYKDINNITVID